MVVCDLVSWREEDWAVLMARERAIDGLPTWRSCAAQQRLALAGLAEEAAVVAHLDVLVLVAAIASETHGCILVEHLHSYRFKFSGLVGATKGVFDSGGALYHIATQGGTARRGSTLVCRWWRL